MLYNAFSIGRRIYINISHIVASRTYGNLINSKYLKRIRIPGNLISHHFLNKHTFSFFPLLFFLFITKLPFIIK